MKVVERIFHHRIRQQIEVDDMQLGFVKDDMQFGFVKAKVTIDAIFLWQNRCRRNLELKVRSSILVLWIWKKNFDSVPSDKLGNA